jgi:hypothetical protein
MMVLEKKYESNFVRLTRQTAVDIIDWFASAIQLPQSIVVAYECQRLIVDAFLE